MWLLSNAWKFFAPNFAVRCVIAKFELNVWRHANFVYVKLFQTKKHINGQNPAKQAHKIWRKNFQALPSYHILGVGSFFSHTLYIVVYVIHITEDFKQLNDIVLLNKSSQMYKVSLAIWDHRPATRHK